MNRFSVVVAFAGLALTGCESRSVNYKLQITSVACTEPQPLSDALQLRFRVTGDGLSTPIDSIVSVSAKAAQLAAIPAGTNRVVEVRAYSGEVASGRVVAVGRSMPFDVPDTLPPEGDREREVKVFLRRANAFSRPSDLQPSSACQKMRAARAGHTATLLPDGKVLVAGGFTLEPVAGGTGYTRTSLSSTEIFDPETGAFTDAPPMGLNNSDGRFSPLPRAFHSATPLSTGQVLLAGGEVAFGGSSFVTATALVFDYPLKPNSVGYGGFQLSAARMRHGAAHDSEAGVLLVGGIGTDGNPVDKVEWYESKTSRLHDTPIAFKRAGMGVLPIQNGKYIAVAGGTDGENVKDEISFFKFDPAQANFVVDPNKAQLKAFRRGAAFAPFADGNRFLLVGGYSSVNDNVAVQAINTSEILKTSDTLQTPSLVDGPNVSSPRGDACAAALPDGRVLVIGGRTGQVGSATRSDSTAELISASDDGHATTLGLAALSPGRYWHTCTTLKDGSVLVLGGLNETVGGDQQALDDAWIFTPAPAGP